MQQQSRNVKMQSNKWVIRRFGVGSKLKGDKMLNYRVEITKKGETAAFLPSV